MTSAAWIRRACVLILLSTVAIASSPTRELNAAEPATPKLRAIELPVDLLGPDWRRMFGVRIDDFDNLDDLDAATKEQAKFLKPQLTPHGILATADYSLDRTKPPFDTVTVRVFIFKDEEACKKWWNTKYQHAGWEKFYAKVETPYDAAVDSLQINKRAIRQGNIWVTTQQKQTGKLHLTAVENVLKQLTEK